MSKATSNCIKKSQPSTDDPRNESCGTNKSDSNSNSTEKIPMMGNGFKILSTEGSEKSFGESKGMKISEARNSKGVTDKRDISDDAKNESASGNSYCLSNETISLAEESNCRTAF